MEPIQFDNIDGLTKASQYFLDRMKLHLGDDGITTVIKEGDIAKSILEVAKDMSCDIVAIGTHSKKWLENIVIGSVAEKVLRNTSIPLFIIPTN